MVYLVKEKNQIMMVETSIMSVSYTHLPLVVLAHLVARRREEGEQDLVVGKLAAYGPVSYTHLDVYKRQELFELAMHPEQYRNYKSGQAKKNFLADLQAAKDKELSLIHI